MVQKVGELSWFERMTKEFENDPEYLREYIMLCSSQIKDQETKIAALEQRFDALSTKFSAMVEENAALEKLCGDLDNLLCEYEAKLDSIFNYVQDGVEPSDFMLSFSVVREVFDKIDQCERRCEEAEQDRDELKKATEYWEDQASSYEVQLEGALKENALLKKRLEPIKEWWERNCSEYIRKKHKKWDASMYEAIEKAMELKED